MILRGRNDFVFLDKNGKKQKYTTTLRNSLDAEMVVNIIKLIDIDKYDKFIYCKNKDCNYFVLGGEKYNIHYIDRDFEKTEKSYTETCRKYSSGYELLDWFYNDCKYPDRVLKVEDADTGIEIEGLKDEILKKGIYKVYYSPYNMPMQVANKKVYSDDTVRNIVDNFNFKGIYNIVYIENSKKEKFFCQSELSVDYFYDGKVEDGMITCINNGERLDIVREKILNDIRSYEKNENLESLEKFNKAKILGIRQDEDGQQYGFIPLAKKDRLFKNTIKGKTFEDTYYTRMFAETMEKENFEDGNDDDALLFCDVRLSSELQKERKKRIALWKKALKEELKKQKIVLK